jgi:hypothetical protein
MIASRFVKFPPTIRGNWKITGSIYKNTSICIVAIHTQCSEIKIKFFLDEEDAKRFVESF